MNTANLCMGCMQELPPGLGVCPYCKFDKIEYFKEIEEEEQSVIATNRKTMNSGTTAVKELPQRPLPLGTIIGGSYIIGKRLGAGGFGVSYIGFDINFERKVAIKEFYPRGCVERDITGTNLVPKQGKRSDYFYEQRETFAHEGKVLAQFDQPGVVRVLSFCREYNTAYIIMEYLEGQSLSDYMRERGGYLPAADALELVKPVVKSLAKLHEKGVIHRDISPDNIMMTASGPKLIDFGAALGHGEHISGPPIGKKGYAPIEQLRRNGKLGTYSDVYALCAMIYQMITSQKPERSLDRANRLEANGGSYDGQVSSDIYNISAYQVYIPPVQEAAIMQGLAMDYRCRIKNAGDLYYLLYIYGVDASATVDGLEKKVKESATDVILQKMKEERIHKKSKTGIILATVLVFILGCMIIAVRQISKNMKAVESETSKPVVVSDLDDDDDDSSASGDEKVTADDLADYRDELYESLNSDREDDGKEAAIIDDDYEDAANYAVEQCANAQCDDSDEWSRTMTASAEKGMKKYDIQYSENSGVGWIIRAYNSDMTIENVKQDIYDYISELNAGNDDAIDLLNCSRIGISVGVHQDGTYFWMIIYS